MRENIFKTIYTIERNGKTFLLHWRYKFDPVTMAVVTGIGTAMKISGTLQQGREAEEIGKRRAGESNPAGASRSLRRIISPLWRQSTGRPPLFLLSPENANANESNTLV